MGRTIPTYRMMLDQEIDSWKPFKKILREDDLKLFDDMLYSSFQYRDAAGCACRPIIFEAMTMSILLSHHRLLRDVQKKLAKQQSESCEVQEQLLNQGDG